MKIRRYFKIAISALGIGLIIFYISKIAIFQITNIDATELRVLVSCWKEYVGVIIGVAIWTISMAIPNKKKYSEVN